mmetsp:Transcript_11753/g.27900  ORF Transcript_11753/g.27900 Transcript_11753/m.27900 type:complete len:500 (-) Transcript_11753:1014-2513(-)
MDNYNDGSRVVDGNFDDPRLTDYDTLLENLEGLRSGKAVQMPIYDFKLSSRVGYQTLEVPSSRVIILEGIYALSSRLRGLMDLRVSITGGVHFDLVKRVLRDIDRSGQAPAEIIQQVSDTVYPMYKVYIEPDLATAHIRIYNTFNPFSGFMDATYILKSGSCPPVQRIEEAIKGLEYTKREESTINDIYLLPPGEDPETCQSWLRMRSRDGRYSLVFEEWVTDGPYIISPRIMFEVSVRILGGLMALGYEIGTIMQRKTVSWDCPRFTIKVDDIEGMPSRYIQIQGKSRSEVYELGKRLGLEGTYVPQSYIEQAQINKLTSNFTELTETFKREIAGSSPFPSSGFLDGGGGLLGTSHGSVSEALSQSLANARERRASAGKRAASDTGELAPPSPAAPRAPSEGSRGLSRAIAQLAGKVELLSSRQPITTAALETQIQTLARESQQLSAEVRRIGGLLDGLAAPRELPPPAPALLPPAVAWAAAGAIAGLALGAAVARGR